ncbi:hypothetical protein EVC62_02075 [Salinicola endophyticus]|uniref:DUF4760 domain-containing protein n=1 Tax=Salinicola endophyticus TaxID=1949083 RepID=A0ABY8FC53_9GAMM|nr:hypothetical protein [Salinicola endophyticus]WFF40381.1 hypothetical protein EVC62_02075 [Salinicola endophyticus]
MQLVASVLVALVTAILTANLAISRFKRERVWEKQAESYSRILHGIESAARHSEGYILNYYQQGDPDQASSENHENMDSLLKKRKKAELDLQELHARYHFFLSKNTRGILDRFHRGVAWEAWEDGSEVAEKDLDHLKALKRDIETEAELAVDASPSNTWAICRLLFRRCDSKLLPLTKKLEQKLQIKF